MTEGIVIAIITGGLALAGSLISQGRHSNVILHRIEQLEKKQDKHNGLVERMIIVEQSTKSAHHRLDGLQNS